MSCLLSYGYPRYMKISRNYRVNFGSSTKCVDALAKLVRTHIYILFAFFVRDSFSFPSHSLSTCWFALPTTHAHHLLALSLHSILALHLLLRLQTSKMSGSDDIAAMRRELERLRAQLGKLNIFDFDFYS